MLEERTKKSPSCTEPYPAQQAFPCGLEQRKTEKEQGTGFLVLATRKMEKELFNSPYFSRGLCISFHFSRVQNRNSRSSFFAPKPHGNA